MSTSATTWPLPEPALRWQTLRASGPGGQHVNKTESAVLLNVDLLALGLPEDALQRLRSLAGRRLSKDGLVLQLRAQASRAQEQNRAAALRRLQTLIAEALISPVPRKATVVPQAAKRARAVGKQHRSRQKSLRQRPPGGDD